MYHQPENIEFWQVGCTHCRNTTYYKFHKKPAWFTKSKWPILECRCGKRFSFLESNKLKFTICQRIPDKEVTALIRRQCVSVYEE